MIKTRYKIQEYFSKETKIHCDRVEQYTKAMAEELRLSAYDTKMLTVAAKYHDIGKYYIPEKILNAPRPLTGLERKVHCICTHTMDMKLAWNMGLKKIFVN